ncbi:MAG TPA: hypothetical protein VEB19_07490 [Gemmatimonadaceae bacterium]|nr:hypothetical protein [Gemmatimonadaceae bacterium]
MQAQGQPAQARTEPQARLEADAALYAQLEAQAAQIARAIEAQQQQQPVVVDVRPGGGVSVTRSGSPTAIWQAARQQRSELRDQLERLEDQRGELRQELRTPASDADTKGIEQRLATVDARILDVEKQIAEADANVARAAAIPGAVQEPRPIPRSGPPEEVFVLAGIFMFIVVLPLTIAYARRIWRRGAAVVSAIPQEIYDRFNRLDQAIDSVAIEVERIGESQRYLTRAYTDQQRGLGAGAAERVEVQDRERVGERPR